MIKDIRTLNQNKIIRDSFIISFNKILQNKQINELLGNNFAMLFLIMREDYYEYYKCLISSMYPIYYINNKYFKMNNNVVPKNEKCNYNMPALFDCIENLEELDSLILANPSILNSIIMHVCSFETRSFLEKREIFKKTSSYDKYLSSINPLYFLDKFEYSFDFNGDYIYNMYMRLYAEKSEEGLSSYAINDLETDVKKEICFFLQDLSFYDTDTYSNLFDELLFDSYKFVKFLGNHYSLNAEMKKYISFLENEDVTFEKALNIGLDEEDLSNDESFLYNVVNNYILYRTRGDELPGVIDEYFNKRQSEVKIKRKNNKGLK